MQIGEICKLTGLTKKAVNYYEAQGLIKPAQEPNGYRIYGKKELEHLKIITALRQLDIPLAKIRTYFDGTVTITTLLENQKKHLEQQAESLQDDIMIIENFLKTGDNSPENLIKLKKAIQMNQMYRSNYLQKELLRIFPGGLGRMLAFVYGAMLDVPLDTEEKKSAWINLVYELDQLPALKVPQDIDDYYTKKELKPEYRDIMIQKYTDNDYPEYEKIQISGLQKFLNQEPDPQMEKTMQMQKRLAEYIKREAIEYISCISKYMPLLSNYAKRFGKYMTKFFSGNKELTKAMFDKMKTITDLPIEYDQIIDMCKQYPIDSTQ